MDVSNTVGVYGSEGPPVPIPNTVVKLISADNTWLEAAREDKAMPTQLKTTAKAVVFIFYVAKKTDTSRVPTVKATNGLIPSLPIPSRESL